MEVDKVRHAMNPAMEIGEDNHRTEHREIVDKKSDEDDTSSPDPATRHRLRPGRHLSTRPMVAPADDMTSIEAFKALGKDATFQLSDVDHDSNTDDDDGDVDDDHDNDDNTTTTTNTNNIDDDGDANFMSPQFSARNRLRKGGREKGREQHTPHVASTLSTEVR